MKRLIRASVLINQSAMILLQSQFCLSVFLLINSWHQSLSLKSTNNLHLNCQIALTHFEHIGETRPPCVHPSVHAADCICQIHGPLIVFLHLRIYFINTVWSGFCCFLHAPVGMPPPFVHLACLMVCKHKPIPLRCFSRLHFQVPA